MTARAYTLEHTRCCVCAADVFMHAETMTTLRVSHQLFYCINGHSQRFLGETEAERKIAELERQVIEANRARDAALARAREAEHEAVLNAHKCAACGKRYTTARGLRDHEQRTHTGIKRLPANAGRST